MSDRPHAGELLAIARETLLQELLPQLPASTHYATRMIANAMAIAQREYGSGPLDGALRDRMVELAALDRGSDLDSAADALTDRLRAGAFDNDAGLRAALHRMLIEWVSARLAISNPKAIVRSQAAS